MVNKKALVVLVVIGVLLSVATIWTAPKVYTSGQIFNTEDSGQGKVSLIVQSNTKAEPMTANAVVNLNVKRGEING